MRPISELFLPFGSLTYNSHLATWQLETGAMTAALGASYDSVDTYASDIAPLWSACSEALVGHVDDVGYGHVDL